MIETVFDELKNMCQIEHSRHRSYVGFMSNLLAGLIAYCHQTKEAYIKKCPVGAFFIVGFLFVLYFFNKLNDFLYRIEVK